ncbi:hypothetical protein A2U01_0082381, partial [Trifolium medium]|nr:hypothetical protein [Trifolium medium]
TKSCPDMLAQRAPASSRRDKTEHSRLKASHSELWRVPSLSETSARLASIHLKPDESQEHASQVPPNNTGYNFKHIQLL